jgi:DNA/RNA-binding domain of Phe-tRNA-synthetase-like protein
MTGYRQLSTDPVVATIVTPAAFDVGRLVVRDRWAPLEEALARAEAEARAADRDDNTALVRGMYRAVGIDPTKTRPSSEALWRRVRRGEPLPRVNSLVDVINWCSLESQLPFGLYDAGKIQGSPIVRLGREGESYAGIRKDEVHLASRLVIADDLGPFGNPTSDSARTMVTVETTTALVVVYAPAGLARDGLDGVVDRTWDRIGRYCTESHPVQSPA